MTLMHRCPPGAPLCETCQAEYDRLMDFLKDNAKDIESAAPSGQTDFDWLRAKAKAKQYIDANVWDSEDRAGCHGDSARFTPDELQELVDEMLEHLST